MSIRSFLKGELSLSANQIARVGWIVFVVMGGILVYDLIVGDGWTHRGARGDFWGGHIGAGAAAAGFFLTAAALMNQTRELRLQIREMRSSRQEQAELVDATKALNESYQALIRATEQSVMISSAALLDEFLTTATDRIDELRSTLGGITEIPPSRNVMHQRSAELIDRMTKLRRYAIPSKWEGLAVRLQRMMNEHGGGDAKEIHELAQEFLDDVGGFDDALRQARSRQIQAAILA